jgi:uncharacterized protein (TIGR02284 family)
MRQKNRMKTIKIIGLTMAPMVFFGSYHTPTSAQTLPQNHQQSDESARQLKDLAQYQIDGSFLLLQGIENVNSQALKSKLQEVHKQYEENIKNLSNLLTKQGGEFPKYSRDFKGYFMSGYAAMRGIFTDKGVLKALETNLESIQKAFDSALNSSSSLSLETKEAVRKVYESNQKALQTIKAEL